MDPLFTLEAPARIHVSLINESGLFGRIDGGIGFSINDPKWVIDVYRSQGKAFKEFENPSTETEVLIDQALAKLGQRFTTALSVKLKARFSLESHIGLGSKTSLLLAVGKIVCELEGVRFDPVEMASLLGRGGTSGVGVHLADKGGIVWDAGRKYPSSKSEFGPSSLSLDSPPKLLLRQYASWLQVIHFRVAEVGIFGQRESDIFRENCPVPSDETAAIIGITASLILPSLVERDEVALQHALSSIQNLGMKKVEWDNQDPVTKQFRSYWLQSGQDCALGLSSMGPTMYVLTSRPNLVLKTIEQSGFHLLHSTITSIRDSGFAIKHPTKDPAP